MTMWIARNINIILLSLLCASLIDVHGKKKQGKYVMNHSSGVNVCDDPVSQDFMDTQELKAVRFNESIAMLDGSFTLKKPIDGLVKVKIVIEKVLASGTREVFLTYDLKDFCNELIERHKNSTQAKFLRAITFPSCPVPPGQYNIVNLIADTASVPMNAMMVGSYIITFTYYQLEKVGSGFLSSTKDTKLGCLYFDCIIEPDS